MGTSDFLALLALMISILSFVYTIYSGSKDHKLIEKEYLYKFRPEFILSDNPKNIDNSIGIQIVNIGKTAIVKKIESVEGNIDFNFRDQRSVNQNEKMYFDGRTKDGTEAFNQFYKAEIHYNDIEGHKYILEFSGKGRECLIEKAKAI